MRTTGKTKLFQLFIISLVGCLALVSVAQATSKEPRRRGGHQRQRQLTSNGQQQQQQQPLGRAFAPFGDEFGYISDAMLPDGGGVHGDESAHQHGGGAVLRSDLSTTQPAATGTVTNAKPGPGHSKGIGANDEAEEDAIEDDDDEEDGYDEDGGELLGNFDEDSRAAEDRGHGPGGHDSLDYTDNFEAGAIDQIESFGGGTDGTPLPVFLVEPESAYVMKNRPAELYCKASHALQISFKCSGSTKPPPTVKEHHTDPHSGVQLQEATATITRELVDEYFGKGPFKCECRAYSSRGHVKTQPVTIQVATIKKQINISPKSVRVSTGGRAELVCNTNAIPAAKVIWQKNGVAVKANPPYVLISEYSLLIARVEMQDMANYTCIAENIAGKRVSEPVPITVYVDGGWSAWGPWTDCKCPGHPKQGQKRTRTCNSPVPLNSGAPCAGPSTETTPDCLPCSAGRWSTWSEWSECGVDCTQSRQRSCMGGGAPLAPLASSSASATSGGASVVSAASLVANSTAAAGSASSDRQQAYVVDSGTIISCVGKSHQSVKCAGGMCNYSVQDSNWTIFLWVALIAIVCVVIGAGFSKFARRKKTIPAYNLARSEMPTEYFANENKKLTHFQPDLTQNTMPINYEYPLTAHHHHHQHNHHQHHQHSQPPHLPGHHHQSSLHHQHGSSLLGPTGHPPHHQNQSQHQQPPPPQPPPTLPIGGLKTSLVLPRSNSEHHYDVPHLCNNYVYPLDKVSINESYSSSTYSKRVCSVESLETSTNTSGDSAYDQQQQLVPMLGSSGSMLTPPTGPMRPTTLVEDPLHAFRSSEVTQATLTPAGALLRLHTYSTALLIPEGAIPKSQRHSVVLSVVRDDKHQQVLAASTRTTYLSPVVFCGPVDTKVNKPIVMQLPHCAENLSNWSISLYSAPDNVTPWSKVVTIGEETINTPALVQIDRRYAYLLTETFGKYVLVGESAHDIQERVACKKLRLFICGPSTVPEFSDVCVRIYIVEDNPGAEERCRHCEQEIGGVLLGGSTVLYFADTGRDLSIDLRCVGGWKTKPFSERQTIPFSHVWGAAGTALHCSFTLCRTEHDKCDFKISVRAAQDLQDTGPPLIDPLQTDHAATLSVSSFVPLPRESHPSGGGLQHQQHSSGSFETMTICSVGSGSAPAGVPAVVENNILNSDRFRLSKDVKRKLCKCLDPPTQKRNDWRMLAAHLNVDRYLTYFATRPSPTDQILDLWECRNRDLTAVQRLIEICRTMERPDAVAILEQIQPAPWL